MRFLVALLLLAIPSFAIAAGTSFKLGEIAPKYTVDKDSIDVSARIRVVDSESLEAVNDVTVEVAWMKSNKTSTTASSCVTAVDGSCQVHHSYDWEGIQAANNLPAIGVRVIGLNHESMAYEYAPNTTFAWVIFHVLETVSEE
jgi:hypothetical protein